MVRRADHSCVRLRTRLVRDSLCVLACRLAVGNLGQWRGGRWSTGAGARVLGILLRAAAVTFVLGSASAAYAAAPTAATSAATSVTSTSALLNGSGNPNGEMTTGWYRINTANPGTCNDTFGTRVPAT